jgi:hypothetical protein
MKAWNPEASRIQIFRASRGHILRCCKVYCRAMKASSAQSLFQKLVTRAPCSEHQPAASGLSSNLPSSALVEPETSIWQLFEPSADLVGRQGLGALSSSLQFCCLDTVTESGLLFGAQYLTCHLRAQEDSICLCHLVDRDTFLSLYSLRLLSAFRSALR